MLFLVGLVTGEVEDGVVVEGTEIWGEKISWHCGVCPPIIWRVQLLGLVKLVAVPGPCGGYRCLAQI